MWYDTLSEEKQKEIQQYLTKFKNPEKDPKLTREFLKLTLKHAAVFSPLGEYRRLKAHTRENEHQELEKALRLTSAQQTLEVGFAYGSSALVFAEHHQKTQNTGISHFIIDPNQYGTGDGSWEGIGAENLKRVGFTKGRNWKLLEETSIQALPHLLRTKGTSWLDVVLIDGWHTFDYTLLDVFYCLQLLRVGGYLILDDRRMNAVSAVAKYVTRAYKHVTDSCKTCKSILVIKKTAEDMRDWDTDETVNFNLS